MKQTQWSGDPNRIVPNRAIAYLKSVNDFRIAMPNENAYGPRGLLTTTEDRLKWNNYFQNGKLGSSSLLSKQTETELLGNGSVKPYAAGFFIKKFMGWNNISHDGATAGYRAYLETFSQLHISIVILSNTSRFTINNIANANRKIFVPDKTATHLQAEQTEQYIF